MEIVAYVYMIGIPIVYLLVQLFVFWSPQSSGDFAFDACASGIAWAVALLWPVILVCLIIGLPIIIELWRE